MERFLHMHLHVVDCGAGEENRKSFIGERKRGKTFPMTAKNNTMGEFVVAVIEGEDVTLKDVKSAVSIDVPPNVEGTLWQKVHTEFSRFLHIVPEEECFIGPVAEFHLKTFKKDETSRHRYRIKIPHCLQTEEQMSSVMVRCGDTRMKAAFFDLPRKENLDDLEPGFAVNGTHIVIFSHHLSDFVCSCKKTSCDFIMVFPFGNLTPHQELNMTTAKITVYLCPSLYKIEDFQQVRMS